MSNFPGWVNVPANELQIGDLGTAKARVQLVIVHPDGSTSVKWSSSPRVQEYPAGRTVSVRNHDHPVK
jgi:hypothetical protein